MRRVGREGRLWYTFFTMTNGVFMGEEEKQFESFYKRSQLLIKLRPIAKRVGLGMLIAFDVVTIVYATARFVDYGVFDFFTDRALIGSIVDGVGDWRPISVARAAEDLDVADADVFPLTDNRVDFYGEVSNPNADWYASFTYQFVSSAGVTEEKRGFVLPGEQKKPIIELAASFDSTPSSAELRLVEVDWIRVNHHLISDYATWEKDRLNFAYSDVTYNREVPIDSTTVGRSTFTVTNNGAYGYYDARFIVVLQRNGKAVGVTAVNLQEYEPDESRDLTLTWFGTPPVANETRIVADVDIFDPASYLPLRGDEQIDVRLRIRPATRR